MKTVKEMKMNYSLDYYELVTTMLYTKTIVQYTYILQLQNNEKPLIWLKKNKKKTYEYKKRVKTKKSEI